MPSPLSSPHNPRWKEIRRAVEQGTLTRDGLAVCEGPRLLEEARRSPVQIRAVYATAAAARGLPAGCAYTEVAENLFRSFSGTETPQGVLALVEPREAALDSLPAARRVVLVLDGVQDPGNAGTLVRAAEAFGAAGVVFLKGAVSPWNPKTIRASAGSLFRVPMAAGVEPAAICALAGPIYALLPDAGSAPDRLPLRGGGILVVGSEARGVSEAIRAIAQPLRIPTAGVESLNAAVAGAILLYEAARQRSRKR
jgi:TrmH family RNA methyltransferase